MWGPRCAAPIRRSGSSCESEFLETEVELAARPRVGGRIRDLLRRELLRRPVRGLRALGNAEAEKDRREVSHACLPEPVALRRPADVDHRLLLEREHLLQL